MNEYAGIRVLHVDDEPDLTKLTAEMLKRKNNQFAVEPATSASAGLDRLAEDDFDCIVSDYDMHGQNGIEFLKTVREEYPDLPFVLYTGKGSEAVASDAIAAGATDYLQKGSGIDHYNLLANRILNAVDQYRTRQRAVELNRIRTLARDINKTLVRVDTRSEAETRVCEIFSKSEPYLFAWIGGVNSDTDRIVPRVWAGVEEGYLDEITVTADDTATGAGPSGTAVRERRVAVSQDVQQDPEFAPWREAALNRGYLATAAVPLEFEGTLFGVLNIYSERPHAIDDNEQDLLAELGADIAHAIHSLELEAEIREEREFIDQAIDALDDLFYLVGTDGTLRRWNKRLTEVTGYTDEELTDMQVTDLFTEDKGEAITDGIEEALSTGLAVVEAEFLTKAGNRIPYELSRSRLTDIEGDVTGLIGIGRDITERKKQKRKREQIIDRVTDAIVEVDSDWRFTLVNKQAEELYDMDEEELLGRTSGRSSTKPETLASRRSIVA